MPTPPRPHNYRALWLTHRVVATCDCHFMQPLLNTGKPVAIRVGAR